MAEKKSESVVWEIKRKTRRKYLAEERISIVLEGLSGEDSISAICRREGIAPNLYYCWSKDFLEAGKKRLMGDTLRKANSSEVACLRNENEQLKALVAELALKNRVLLFFMLPNFKGGPKNGRWSSGTSCGYPCGYCRLGESWWSCNDLHWLGQSRG